jgi:hypothetical protein
MYWYEMVVSTFVGLGTESVIDLVHCIVGAVVVLLGLTKVSRESVHSKAAERHSPSCKYSNCFSVIFHLVPPKKTLKASSCPLETLKRLMHVHQSIHRYCEQSGLRESSIVKLEKGRVPSSLIDIYKGRKGAVLESHSPHGRAIA